MTTKAADAAPFLELIGEYRCNVEYQVFDTAKQKELEELLAQAKGHLVDILNKVEKAQMIESGIWPTLHFDHAELKPIGKGSFGSVWKGIFKGTPVAIKSMKNVCEKELARLTREMKIMQTFSHPHLARFMGTASIRFDVTNGVPVMIPGVVSELCDTDLSKACQEEWKNNPHFQTRIVMWLCEAAEGIAWLHEVWHMIHRDVKPANILLKNGHAVVTDFGFTQVVDTADGTLTDKLWRGTANFMAPELIKHQSFSYPVDVYAFGVTMYEVLSGIDPSTQECPTTREFFRIVCNGGRPDVSRLITQGINDKLIILITRCWDGDPLKRPTMIQVCNELKEIFVEIVVPKTNPAYSFWLSHFRDRLADEVELSDLLSCLPNKEDKVVEEAYKWILKGRANPNTVTLCHLGNTCEWYGDWIHKGTALALKRLLEPERWFLGFVSQGEAIIRGLNFLFSSKRPCFFVRCNAANSLQIPFIVDIFTPAMITSHQVEKVGDKLQYSIQYQQRNICVSGNNVLELINILFTNNLLFGAYPYDGTMIWVTM